MIRAEYIGSGTFVTGEEAVYDSGIESNDAVVILTMEEYNRLVKLLETVTFLHTRPNNGNFPPHSTEQQIKGR